MKSQNWNKRLAAVIFAVMAVCLCAGLWSSAPRGGGTYAADTDTVTVSGLSVEWDGNYGAQDLVFLALDGATFASPEACNETWAYFESSIFINGVAATGNVEWAQTRQYDRPGTFAVFIKNGVLKQDGTDVIEIAADCKIPKVGGADADYYVVSEKATFRAGKSAPTGEETFSKIFSYEADKKYDASNEIFAATDAGKTLGDATSIAVASENFGVSQPTWGFDGWATYTGAGTETNNYAEFRLVNDLDASKFKSITLEVKHDTAAGFYLFPLTASGLQFADAVQSVEWTGGKASVTLSTEKLAGEDGIFRGFLLRRVTGSASQIFIESMTVSAEPYTPEKEDLTPPEWKYEAEKEYDADSSLFKQTADESLGGYSVKAVYHTSDLNGQMGIVGSVTYTSAKLNESGVGDMVGFKLAHPIDPKTYKSVTVKVVYRADACFYLYPSDAKEFGYENAKQSFRTGGKAETVAITLSTESLKDAEGSFGGFLLQAVTEGSDQFFLDSITLHTAAYNPKPVEDVRPFAYENGKEYDASDEIFAATADKTQIGDAAPLEVSVSNLGQLFPALGIDGWAAHTNEPLARGNFVRIKFVNPVDATSHKRVTLKIKYDADAGFYVYRLDADALGFDKAVQSVNWKSGTAELTVSAESLAGEGDLCEGFLLQLAAGSGAQLFIESMTVSAEPYTPEKEDLTPPEWKYEAGVEYDADTDLFSPEKGGVTVGEAESLAVAVSNIDQWGISKFAAHTNEALSEDNFVIYRFVHPIDSAAFPSMTLKILHNGNAGFYLYKPDTSALGFESAVRSVRFEGGLATITLSTAELAGADGLCTGFALSLGVGSGAQFFADSVTLSTETVAPEKEDLTPPEWTEKKVSVTGVTFTREYDKGVDMFILTFSQDIFTADNENLNADDLLLGNFTINGKSLKESGITAQVIRKLFTNPKQLGIIVKNDTALGMRNDGFDTVRIEPGFAVPGSTGDYTRYCVKESLELYTNMVVRDGQQISLSENFDPPMAEDACRPQRVELLVEGETAKILVVFDQAVGKVDASKLNRILPFVSVQGTLLSDWGGDIVTLSAEDNVLTISFPSEKLAAGLVKAEIKEGLTIFSDKTVKATVTFVQLAEGERILFGDSGAELRAYWISTPVIGEGIAKLSVRFSAESAELEAFESSVLDKILIGETPLSSLLAEDKGVQVSLDGYMLNVVLPESVLTDGLAVTVEAGFKLPDGSETKTGETFRYDAQFGEFFVTAEPELLDGISTPTGITSVLTAKDGVAEGTNQLFIQFDTPSSHKYLPFVQESPEKIFAQYGGAGVSMTERYAYELSKYGIRDSVWDKIFIDGKSVREWALEDRAEGVEWKRLIDIYYVGTVFNDYYMQIVIGKGSSAVMDWSKPHTISFRAGFVTPEFGVIAEDQNFIWDTEAQNWQIDTTGEETVKPGASLKPESPGTEKESGCGGCQGSAEASVAIAAALAALAVVGRRMF